MANVVITGGAGFLGARLARELLTAGGLAVAGEPAHALSRLTLADRAPVPADLAADPRVSAVTGDLVDLLSSPDGTADLLADADVVFHLAAAVSGECEADFDLGLHANLRATQALLASCRKPGRSAGVGWSGEPGRGNTPSAPWWCTRARWRSSAPRADSLPEHTWTTRRCPCRRPATAPRK